MILMCGSLKSKFVEINQSEFYSTGPPLSEFQSIEKVWYLYFLLEILGWRKVFHIMTL